MSDEIKIEIPKFSIEEPEYNFQAICATLGLITLGDVAFRPEAIVLMEDGAARESDGEEDDADFCEPCTLVHFANQQSIELDAGQMAQLEQILNEIRSAMRQAMAAQNPLNQSAVRNAAALIAQKAGLRFDRK